MSAAHTPGPWTMETVPTSCGVVFKVGPFPWKQGKLNHACIYADYPSTEGHAICTANARLIAAAPDLLAACEAQHRAIDHLMAKLIALDDEFMPTRSEAWAAVEQAHDAVAKATGAAS